MAFFWPTRAKQFTFAKQRETPFAPCSVAGTRLERQDIDPRWIGVYYSLIDDLAFQLNSLYPYNGTVSYTGSLPTQVPVVRNTTPCRLARGVPAQCSIYAPVGIHRTQLPRLKNGLTVEQQLDRNTVVRVAYVGSFGYHQFVSIDPNSIPRRLAPTPRVAGPAGSVAPTDPPLCKARSTLPLALDQSFIATAFSGIRKATAATTLCRSM
jgi:hypothetical protein